MATDRELCRLGKTYRGRDAKAAVSKVLEQLVTRGVVLVDAGLGARRLYTVPGGPRVSDDAKRLTASDTQIIAYCFRRQFAQLQGPLRVSDFRQRVGEEPTARLSRRVPACLTELARSGELRRVDRMRGDANGGRWLYVPAGVTVDTLQRPPLTFTESVAVTVERLWSQRVVAAGSGHRPSPLLTADVREALQALGAVGVGTMHAQRVVNAMQALAKGSDARIRRVRRAEGGKSLYWAPVDWSDAQLDLDVRAASEHEQLVRAVRQCCAAQARPAVSARDVDALLRVDPSLAHDARSRTAAQLSDASRPDGKRHRSRTVERAGMIGGTTLYCAPHDSQERTAARSFAAAGNLVRVLEVVAKRWALDDPGRAKSTEIRELRVARRTAEYTRFSRKVDRCTDTAFGPGLLRQLRELRDAVARPWISEEDVIDIADPETAFVPATKLTAKLLPLLKDPITGDEPKWWWRSLYLRVRKREAPGFTWRGAGPQWLLDSVGAFWWAAESYAGPTGGELAVQAADELGDVRVPRVVLRAFSTAKGEMRRRLAACIVWMLDEPAVLAVALAALERETDGEVRHALAWGIAVFRPEAFRKAAAGLVSKGPAHDRIQRFVPRTPAEVWRL